MDFTSLNLCQPLLDALDEIGYVSPTPIQARAIPDLIEGRDIIGCAQTGTGKTAAFARPILDAMAKDRWVGSRRIRALMLCPTRELATQIHDNIEQYARHLDIRSMAMFGGVSQRPQEKILRRGVDILVATPVACLTSSHRDTLTCPTCSSSFSMRRIACSTWVSSETSVKF